MPPSLLLDLQNVLVALALITPRALVCLSILPGFGMKTLTGMAKNAVAMAIALPAVLPTFYAVQAAPPDVWNCAALSLKEACIGLLLGVVMAIPIWVAQSVGSILDMQRQPIQIQANSQSIDKDASALGAMLLQAMILVMIQSGLFVVLTRILIESFSVWPAYHFFPPFEPYHLSVLLKQFGAFFWHVIVYGGPVLIPLLLIDFGFAMIGAFAPNLQVSAASSPVKSVAGIFILFVYWPGFSHYVAGDFASTLDFFHSMIQAGKP